MAEDKEAFSVGNALDSQLIRRVYNLIRPYRRLFYFSIVLTLLLSVVQPAVPQMVQLTIDEAVIPGHDGLLQRYGLAILGLLLLQTALFYTQTYLTNWLGQSAIKQLRSHIFRHISTFRLRVFDRTPIGTFITRTINDVETVADIFAQGLITIIGDLLKVFIIVGIMLYTDWRLTLVTLSVLPLLIATGYVFKQKVKSAFQEVRRQVSRMNAFLQEHITGMAIVQVFGREDTEQRHFEAINRDYLSANLRSVLYYSVFFPVIEILSAVSIGAIVWFGTGRVLEDELTFGVLTKFLLFINMLFMPIRQIADRFNVLQMGMVAAHRIFRVLDTQDHLVEVERDNTASVRPIAGSVAFEHVSFRYTDEEWVLKDIDFHIDQGQTLALVGATGSGKTTLTNLLTRLYEHQQGEIKIDGRPVEAYPPDVLRRQIAVVLQDVFLFSDSIRNNIRLFNPSITDEQMREAARMVGAERFIEQLPGGFDFQVQERGATLSAGQRQVISFLRAILQDPRILVLDEATSSVDNETEELIQRATNYLLRDRTAIVVAHRLATIRDADLILVMDKGRIVERGHHQELLERGGKYKELYELQFAELEVTE